MTESKEIETFTEPKKEEIGWKGGMDGYLKQNLDLAKEIVLKDWDMVFCIDGYEGCLTGDTLINVNRRGIGRSYRLDYMYKQFMQNKGRSLKKGWELKHPTYVRSFDGKGIKLHKIKDVLFSGIKEVFEINLSNGRKIKATADHKIMTSKGWVEVKDLTTESQIMCDTLRPQKGKKRSFKLKDSCIHVPFHPHKDCRKEVQAHRLIYEARLNNLHFNTLLDILWNDKEEAKKLNYINPKDFCIHHKDGNHFNNSVENLELLNKKDHYLLHSKKDESFRHFNQGIPIYSNFISKTYIGKEKTYDICCEDPYHNFVANGIVVHNSGKSVLAQQCAKYCDPNFNIDRVCFTPEEFVKAINATPEYGAVVYDEAYQGMSSRAAMSEVNKMLMGVLAEIRQKKLFVFIILPCFFELDKYAAVWRSRGLLHVYTQKKFARGFFSFYNQDRKKTLYVLGKKFFSYSKPAPNFFGRFPKGYTVDEEKYRQKKLNALKAREEKLKDVESKTEVKLKGYLVRLFLHLIKEFNYTKTRLQEITGLNRKTILQYMNQEIERENKINHFKMPLK